MISLPNPSDLTVQIFNVMGQRVATIAEGHFQSGFHPFVFDGNSMASGVYFIHAIVPAKQNQVQKIIMLKQEKCLGREWYVKMQGYQKIFFFVKDKYEQHKVS